MRPLSLTDRQIDIVSQTARALPVEKRDAYLQRLAALLSQTSGRVTDAGVSEAARTALDGLLQRTSAA